MLWRDIYVGRGMWVHTRTPVMACLSCLDTRSSRQLGRRHGHRVPARPGSHEARRLSSERMGAVIGAALAVTLSLAERESTGAEPRP
jgi:hypothetical protein